MLARLTVKVRKDLNMNMESICKESNLRRNKLVLEEIVRRRENEQFLDITSADLFSKQHKLPWAARR